MAAPVSSLPREIGAAIFGGDIAGYEAARIGYPEELYTALRKRCCGPASALLEIGPGTGLATVDLLARLKPDRYVAVEGDPALAAHLANLLAARHASGNAGVVAARFEDFTTPSRFDLACCAAAFHWLDADLAYWKLRQVLKPGGVVALWWNTYRQAGIGDAFADRVALLLARIRLAPSEAQGGHYSLDREHHRDAMTGAGLVDFEGHVFRRERTLTSQEIAELYASYSYVRALPEDDREALLCEIVGIADHEFAGRVPNVVLTALYLANTPHG